MKKSTSDPHNSSILTGVPDADRQILLRIQNDDVLYSVCISNKYAVSLCNDYFWWQKFIRHFGTDLEESSKNGIKINYKKIYEQLKNLKAEKLIFEATENGYIDLVKRLIDNNIVDIDSAQLGDRLLIYAGKNGHLNIVTYLMQKGANVNSFNGAAFVHASSKGHLDVVKYLLNPELFGDENIEGADIHINNDDALLAASENGHLDIVTYLIEHGANIHTQKDYALDLAVMNGRFDVVKYLVDHGVDINRDNDYVLRLASSYGYLNVVKYLVEHGLDIHAYDDAALGDAVKYGYINVVEYLLEHGANASRVDMRMAENKDIRKLIRSAIKTNKTTQCTGTTKKGERCKKKCADGSKYCSIHKQD